MFESPSKAKELTPEEIEAWTMWVYKQQEGILPNQWHHFYEQGETIIYQEHIQDLLTIDKMWNNKILKERNKAEAAQRAKEKNPLKNKGGGSGFYGQTYKYTQ